MLSWLLCAVFALTAVVLLVKLLLLRGSLDDMERQLERRMNEDTNNLIFLSTRDAHARRLAARLSNHLEELRRARQRYENGDRELKEAVTDISHDLRTPLTAICGYLELLERTETTPEQARYLSLIAGRAESMKGLTEELLRYSVAAGGEEELCLETVDLNAAVEEAAASFYGAFTQSGVTPNIFLPQERVVRKLDRAALARVLGNLLGNALKYSGGDLEVSLTPEGVITLSNLAPGLDEVQVGRLFDRFFTVETGRGSTGLGLSIARALTERMGGSIGARYETGRLVICLAFPAEQAASS